MNRQMDFSFVASDDATPIFDTLHQIAIDIRGYKNLIRSAIPYTNGTHTAEDVCLAILAGKLKLWTAPSACIVSEFIQYPRKRFLHYFLIAGDLETIIAMQPDIIEFARKNNCDAISGLGRPGWEKITKRLGWDTHERYCVLTLQKDEEHHGQGVQPNIDIQPTSGISGDDQEKLCNGGERI